MNFLRIVCEFFGDLLLGGSNLEIFCEFFENSIRILCEFFWNSIGIFWGCMVGGFWMCGCWFWVIWLNQRLNEQQKKKEARADAFSRLKMAPYVLVKKWSSQIRYYFHTPAFQQQYEYSCNFVVKKNLVKMRKTALNVTWLHRYVYQMRYLVKPPKVSFTRHNNHTPKFYHPYFHWYLYQNTSVCRH